MKDLFLTFAKSKIGIGIMVTLSSAFVAGVGVIMYEAWQVSKEVAGLSARMNAAETKLPNLAEKKDISSFATKDDVTREVNDRLEKTRLTINALVESVHKLADKSKTQLPTFPAFVENEQRSPSDMFGKPKGPQRAIASLPIEVDGEMKPALTVLGLSAKDGLTVGVDKQGRMVLGTSTGKKLKMLKTDEGNILVDIDDFQKK